jgi:protein involved in polysaccharide export with SLBB domain
LEQPSPVKSATPEAASPDAPERPAAPLPAVGAGTEGSAGEISESLAGGITIQPDSLLEISVAEDPTLDGRYQVNQIGAIQLGYVGPVILFNKTEREAEQKIQDVLKYRDFRKATVKVRIIRASYDRIQVLGEVNQPGVITIGAGDGISLNDALWRAGGLRAVSNPTAKIIRGGLLSVAPFTMPSESHALLAPDGQLAIPDVTLRKNDIMQVQAAAPALSVAGKGATPNVIVPSMSGAKTILVLGEVHRAGFYQFGEEEPCSMLHLVLKMGGLPAFANKRAVKILRRDAQGYEEEITVDVDRLLESGAPEDDVSLQNGDRVKVPARRINLF